MSTTTANNVTKIDGKPVLGWTLLSTTVASNDARIDIINLSSDYFMYKFIWSDVKPVSDSNLLIRTSSDNGENWDSAGSDYGWTLHVATMETSPTHVVLRDDADSEMEITSTIGAATNEQASFEITLFNPSGTEYTKVIYTCVRINETGLKAHDMGAGIRRSAAAVNGVRFLMGSGNISQGTLKVYGVRA